ncbi:MAG: HlyC/CorC family transporter [Armatimonadetes bacterium]|nr:HlyC/CorC family transporter [Armatimonadota bacterium]
MRSRLLISLGLVVGTAFFVAAEYAMVSAKRTKVEQLAKKGHRGAKLLLSALDNLSYYLAGTQVAITMLGIGIGAITEPLITEWLSHIMGPVLGKAASIFALVLMTYAVVLIGELIPKYLALRYSERVASATVPLLRYFVLLLHPVVWVLQHSARLLLKLFGISMHDEEATGISKHELALLLRSGTQEGGLDQVHAQLMGRALRFDVLDAADIMVHRLDIKWVSLDSDRDELLRKIASFGHSRVLVGREDLDDLVGVLYLQDLVGQFVNDEFDLEKILRPIEVVPEPMTLNRLIDRMRDAKTQLLVVVDEYGGTSGLITLEDIVEEVFGDIDDRLEAERPSIERVNDERLSVRADVRYDEIAQFLGSPTDEEHLNTKTVAQIIVESLERMPRLADSVETDLGTLRVENMARRRITRVQLQLPKTEVDGPAS